MSLLHNTDSGEVLAIDFGTVNTYMTKCPANECLPQGIHFSTSKTGIATAVLERAGKEAIVGDIAIEEFAEATDEEKKDYKLYTQFKPEIPYSGKARELAETYLSTILSDSEKNHLEIHPLKKQVICGVPCNTKDEQGNKYSEILADIARRAGYGTVKFVEEPIGALLFHVAAGSLSAVDAQKGILVVDFGGGTCDFSVMNRGYIQKSWGNAHLGGRLFDDLFFQWFLEKNPKMLDALKKNHRELFTLMVDCKNIKEKFSEIVSLDKNANVRKTISNYGHLDDMNRNTFLNHAKNYKLSIVLKKYFSEIGLQTTFEETIDLIKWFEELFISGFDDEQSPVLFKDITHVILAGGSSLWFFISDIVKKYIPNAKIIRSDNPYATISEGLALIPALKIKNKKIRNTLTNELPLLWNGSKNEQGLKEKIENLINLYLEKIVNIVAVDVFEKEIATEIISFRESGGKLENLKLNLESKSDKISVKIKQISDSELKELSSALEAEIRFYISGWFNRHKIHLSDNQIFQKQLTYEVNGSSVTPFDNLYSLINSLLAGIAGFSIAILFTNHLTMIIGFVVALFAVFFGSDKINRLIEKKVFLSAFIAKRILSNRRIEYMKKKWKSDLSKELKKKNKEYLSISKDMVMKCIEDEIQALNEINTL